MNILWWGVIGAKRKRRKRGLGEYLGRSITVAAAGTGLNRVRGGCSLLAVAPGHHVATFVPPAKEIMGAHLLTAHSP